MNTGIRDAAGDQALRLRAQRAGVALETLQEWILFPGEIPPPRSKTPGAARCRNGVPPLTSRFVRGPPQARASAEPFSTGVTSSFSASTNSAGILIFGAITAAS